MRIEYCRRSGLLPYIYAYRDRMLTVPRVGSVYTHTDKGRMLTVMRGVPSAVRAVPRRLHLAGLPVAFLPGLR
eukprot:3120112-Rhodomonas_salina.8